MHATTTKNDKAAFKDQLSIPTLTLSKKASDYLFQLRRDTFGALVCALE